MNWQFELPIQIIIIIILCRTVRIRPLDTSDFDRLKASFFLFLFFNDMATIK